VIINDSVKEFTINNEGKEIIRRIAMGKKKIIYGPVLMTG
jgi:hypothetical protein